MSQGSEFFNVVRTAYLRLTPYLEQIFRICLGVSLGSLVFGPPGILVGAATGTAISAPWTQQAILSAIPVITGALSVIQHCPELVQFIRMVLNTLHRYLNGEHEENVNLRNQAMEY